MWRMFSDGFETFSDSTSFGNFHGSVDGCPQQEDNGAKELYGCFQKYWYPQIIHFNRVFHYKPSILGYPYFWKHPYTGTNLSKELPKVDLYNSSTSWP